MSIMVSINVNARDIIQKQKYGIFDAYKNIQKYRKDSILLCWILTVFASMLAVCYSALKASFTAEYHPTIIRL